MSAQAEFERALRRPVPSELQGLDEGLLARLTEFADAERVRRDAELRDSLTEALKEIPLLLRGVAKKAVLRRARIRPSTGSAGCSTPTREELAALLDAVPDKQREALAEHVADAWEARDDRTLKAVLSLLGVLPDVISAKVAQKRMPPRFVARIAPHLSEGSFVSLVGRLKPEFLAEVSAWLDQPRCREVLRAIPQEDFLPAAMILEERGDWDTLAAVGRELDDETFAACVAAFDRGALLEDMEHRDAAYTARVRAALPG